jgi:hypothetical protein
MALNLKITPHKAEVANDQQASKFIFSLKG